MSKVDEGVTTAESPAVGKLGVRMDTLATLCGKNRDIIEESKLFADIQRLPTDFRQQIGEARDVTRRMSIGIIGQVKSGKSSFLNALFFGGDKLLPTAATPMTAALTILAHVDDAEVKDGRPRGEEHAVVHFYTHDDWHDVTAMAQEYQELWKSLKNDRLRGAAALDDAVIDAQVTEKLGVISKSSAELVKFAERIPSAERGMLFGTEVCITFSNRSELASRLGDYVGSDGTYTALTKYIELYLKIDSLKGIMVVDTPGMNDPILSRGAVTESYLKKCDAAFVLSYASQFMNSEDSSYIKNLLPDRGITRIAVLGSKFDLVLLERSVLKEHGGNLDAAIRSTAQKLKVRAIQELKATGKVGDRQVDVELISGMLHAMASHLDRMNEEESLIIDTLKHGYRDYASFLDKPEYLIRLGNIEGVKTRVFDAIRADKNKILEGKMGELLIATTRVLGENITRLQTSIQTRMDRISTTDIDALKKEASIFEGDIRAMRDDIGNIFGWAKKDTANLMDSILRGLVEESQELKDLRVEHRTEQYQVRKESRRLFSGIGRFFGGIFGNDSWGYEWETENRDITYANVRKAVDAVEQYVVSVNVGINKSIKDHIAGMQRQKDGTYGDFGKRLLEAVVNNVNTSSSSYDARTVRSLVNNIVEGIEYPRILLNPAQYTQGLNQTFGSETKDIDKARAALAGAVNGILEQVQRDTKSIADSINRTLEKEGNGFVDKLKGMFESDIKKLKQEIEHKEHYLSQMTVFIKELQALEGSGS